MPLLSHNEYLLRIFLNRYHFNWSATGCVVDCQRLVISPCLAQVEQTVPVPYLSHNLKTEVPEIKAATYPVQSAKFNIRLTAGSQGQAFCIRLTAGTGFLLSTMQLFRKSKFEIASWQLTGIYS